eukprot:s2324_g10.t1
MSAGYAATSQDQPAELSTGPGDQGVLAPSKAEGEVSAKADPTPADKAEAKGDEESATRAKLRQLKKEADGGPKQQELANAAKILRKLSEDTSNMKLYSMRRDVLERAVGVELLFVFEAAGFEERQSETGAVLQWRGPAATESLKDSLQEVQKAADLALDPESMTFQQVSEMVAQGRSLPGILEVDDKVRKPLEPKESQVLQTATWGLEDAQLSESPEVWRQCSLMLAEVALDAAVYLPDVSIPELSMEEAEVSLPPASCSSSSSSSAGQLARD